jgi:APA family basic amino acid/polyamine antiporter
MQPTSIPTPPAASAHPPAGDADGLPRRLGVWSAAAAAVGLTIGSGIFRVPATVAAETGSVGAIALVWVLGGVITLCGALTIAELAAAFPRAGGIYVYLREAYGPLAAFLFGWSWFFIRSAASAGTALVFVAYLRTFVPLDELGQRAAAVGLIVLVGAANYRSVRLGAAIQDASTAAKVLAILLAAAAIFVLGEARGGALAAPPAFAPAGVGGIHSLCLQTSTTAFHAEYAEKWRRGEGRLICSPRPPRPPREACGKTPGLAVSGGNRIGPIAR